MKSILNIHWMGWCWSLNSYTFTTWCEELTHLKRPWCWERLKVGGKGNDRGWDGWMVSPTQWTWVWVGSRSWWWKGSIAEKAMATHSYTLAWKIPWTEEPGRLQSMGSLRVRHNWMTSLSLFTFMHWRRKWKPTPVFLPGESQGWGSLVGCRLWGRTEPDTTEAT